MPSLVVIVPQIKEKQRGLYGSKRPQPEYGDISVVLPIIVFSISVKMRVYARHFPVHATAFAHALGGSVENTVKN